MLNLCEKMPIRIIFFSFLLLDYWPNLTTFQLCDASTIITQTKQDAQRNVESIMIVQRENVIRTCYDGYQLVNGDCEPICESNCYNSKCTAPNRCTCLDGYERDPRNSNACLPVCKQCVNGVCVSPGICECDGLCKIMRVKREVCGDDPDDVCDIIPCDPECVNGICVLGDCECDPGYILLDSISNKCVSDCEYHCKNGRCNQQNMCICEHGYILNDEEKCIPECSNCQNGYCDEPNICECSDGYTKYETNNSSCIPVCNRKGNGCQNGTCIAPNKCECFEGFELSTESPFICFPKNKTCINCEPEKLVTKSSSHLYIIIPVVFILITVVIGGIFYLRKRYSHGVPAFRRTDTTIALVDSEINDDDVQEENL